MHFGIGRGTQFSNEPIDVEDSSVCRMRPIDWHRWWSSSSAELSVTILPDAHGKIGWPRTEAEVTNIPKLVLRNVWTAPCSCCLGSSHPTASTLRRKPYSSCLQHSYDGKVSPPTSACAPRLAVLAEPPRSATYGQVVPTEPFRAAQLQNGCRLHLVALSMPTRSPQRCRGPPIRAVYFVLLSSQLAFNQIVETPWVLGMVYGTSI